MPPELIITILIMLGIVVAVLIALDRNDQHR